MAGLKGPPHKIDRSIFFPLITRDHPRARRFVIPRHDPVVDPEDDVGQIQIVEARSRKALERPAPVVSEISGGAGLKRRQSGNRRSDVRRQQRADFIERAASVRAFASNNGCRIGRQKRVAAQGRSPLGAVEKDPVRQAGELFTTRHRIRRGRQLVRDQRRVRLGALSRTCSDFVSSFGVR